MPGISLKELALDWFYSLSSRSLWSFKEISGVFFNQYASQEEFKKNNNHLFIIKRKPGETLKHYINYLQSPIVIIYNYNDEVDAAVFIVGLQTDHSL